MNELNKHNKLDDFKLYSIYFYLTQGCNLACRHCWINPHFQNGDNIYPSLDFALFKSIISQALPLGIISVKLTGGEPFLHPNIFEILKHIRENNLDVGIETNGVLCSPKIVEELKLQKKVFISVSLDGAKAETHEWVRGVKGCFDSTIQGIKNLVSGGFKPQIIMSIMKHNQGEIEPMINLAENLGAGSVKFNLVQPTARGETMHINDETLRLEELIKIGDWVENQLSQSAKIKIIYSHPIAFRPLSKTFRNNRPWRGCDVLHIMGVLGDGSYALCGIGNSLKGFVWGDARVDKLETIWRYHPVLQKLRQGLPDKIEGICSRCILKKRCFGYCIAQNYYDSKNLWGSYWYCTEAEKLGLFPKTRLLNS